MSDNKTPIWEALTEAAEALWEKYPKLDLIDILTKMDLLEDQVDGFILQVFDGQVCNGGFTQWHYNGYSDTYNLVQKALRKIGTEPALQTLKIMPSLEDLKESDNFDDESDTTDLDNADGAYYKINGQLQRDIEAYFAKRAQVAQSV